MAALVDVAVAVVADLTNGHLIDANGVAVSISHNPPRLSQALTVSRVYIPRFRPPGQDVGQWQVLVSTEGEQTTRHARDAISVEYAVEIGVSGKLADLELTTIDAAMTLLQEMGDFCFDYGLTGSPATWIRNEVLAWPDREILAGNGDLFALWTAVFEGSRTRIKNP